MDLNKYENMAIPERWKVKLSKLLIDYRDERSQKTAAQRIMELFRDQDISIAQSTWSSWEQGESFPDAYTSRALAYVLGFQDVNDFYDELDGGSIKVNPTILTARIMRDVSQLNRLNEPTSPK